jgi:cell division protein FtsW (lipid II flippase)
MPTSDEITSPTDGTTTPQQALRRPALIVFQIGLMVLVAFSVAGGAEALEKRFFGAHEQHQWSGFVVLMWLLSISHERLLHHAWTNAKTYANLFWVLFFGIMLGTATGNAACSWIYGGGISGEVITEGMFMGLAYGVMFGMLLTRTTDDKYGPKPRKGAT